MTFTTDDLSRLNAAIAEGTKKVKYQDKEVEYRSLDEMLKLRDLMLRETGAYSSGSGNRKVGIYNSGL